MQIYLEDKENAKLFSFHSFIYYQYTRQLYNARTVADRWRLKATSQNTNDYYSHLQYHVALMLVWKGSLKLYQSD